MLSETSEIIAVLSVGYRARRTFNGVILHHSPLASKTSMKQVMCVLDISRVNLRCVNQRDSTLYGRVDTAISIVVLALAKQPYLLSFILPQNDACSGTRPSSPSRLRVM